jgi:hydroxyacylglutathione hydrolase
MAAAKARRQYLLSVGVVIAISAALWSFFVYGQYKGEKNTMILTRLVVGPLQVNCFIVEDEKTKDAVVIDPGDDAADILKLIKDKGLKVRYIVNTHGHFDHIGANKAVKEATGAELLIHEADAPMMAAASKQASVFGMQAVLSPPADRFVKDGEVITAGEIALKVAHTPGHSLGGICLLEQGIAFTGDSLFAGSIGRTDLPGGDLKTLLRSIKKSLMVLPDDTRVFSGHGPISTIGEERKENPFLNKESGFE